MNKVNLNLSRTSESSILDIDNISVIDETEREAEKAESNTVYSKIECFVKWFKAEEGFGFLKSEAIESDIFIHCSVLDPMKDVNILPGDKMVCTVVMGHRGPQVDVLHLHVSNQLTGMIKWFNTQYDYGFIQGTPETGNRDIFVQGKKVRGLGINTDKLATGQIVSFTFRIDKKGDLVVDKMKLES